MNNLKLKLLLLGFGIILVMGASILVMVKTLNDAKTQNTNTDNETTYTEVVIEDGEINQDSLNAILNDKLTNKNVLTDNFEVLAKYSENYTTVANWMISEIINYWNENGFTVYDEELGEEVDGLTIYVNATEYMVTLLNDENVDMDELFSMYCPEEYMELNNTYLLGKESSSEYNETSSAILYKELLSLYEQYKFQDILDRVDSLLSNYKFTMPYNYQICNIYQDAQLSLDYDTNQEAIKYGLDYMHTPETYFINFMRLGYFDKYTILKDNKSILPPVNSSIQVLSTETIDLDDSNYSWITSQFWDYTRNAKSVTRIYYSVTTTDIDRNNGFVEVTTTYYYSAYVVNSFTKSRVLLSIKNEDGLDIYSWTCETYNKYVIQGAKYEEETETSTEEETSIENASIDEDIENNEVKIEDVEETSKTEESSSNAIVIEEVITN
jgi:hypothetical protein